MGFNPNIKTEIPRAHLDFSLDPLLLFPPFEYGDLPVKQAGRDGEPTYQFVVNEENIVGPSSRRDGRFRIEIHAGRSSADGAHVPIRYFALNPMEVSVFNRGKKLGFYTINRHRKLGYDTTTFDALDQANQTKPHFSPPLGEQQDVFKMDAVLPARWLAKLGYDWTKAGSISVRISSIWDGWLDGHSHSLEIQLPARKR